MPDMFNVTNRDLVIALAARYGVPAIYFTATYFAKSVRRRRADRRQCARGAGGGGAAV
jgi:hypothetical protein